ncbi:stage V sporulation protein AB [Alkaliphilus serpentinus]|uniref:Stage V sporulation protein AC n=1 Tax=Alkaliphilus serpentinus TaxID=1482731 RepID=A0A833HQ20_9FIRM|nr:stage V sporulation protein AB [Alkaliphilus serpentinus]KAB3531479.1 stage V sporulation protein AC [Alkaliphilus serpentinus]
MKNIIAVIVGLSNGVVVGSGIVALITLLDIIPRLAQLTNTTKYIIWYENVIITGAVLAAFTSLTNYTIPMNTSVVMIAGLFMGIFIGLLASALAEVMNVLPVIVRRVRLEGFVIYILYALIFGKVIGSFINWIIY